jgi:hypothetical protein
LLNARLAFEEAINAISPTIATAYENVSFTPTINVPYQELYDIPASNDHLFVNSSEFESLGIFQITLRYPSGKGSKDAFNRAELYVSSFPVGRKLTKNGDTITVIQTPQINVLGVDGDRYSVAVSINYKSIKG